MKQNWEIFRDAVGRSKQRTTATVTAYGLLLLVLVDVVTPGGRFDDLHLPVSLGFLAFQIFVLGPWMTSEAQRNAGRSRDPG